MGKKGLKINNKTGDNDIPEFEKVNILVKGIQVLLTVVSSGSFGLLGIIFWILNTIFIILMYICTKVIPFLVIYIGIPTFILGAIMGLFFLGGHLLFVIVFFVGIFIYIRKLLGVVYTLPTKNPNSNINNNTPIIKSKSVGY